MPEESLKKTCDDAVKMWLLSEVGIASQQALNHSKGYDFVYGATDKVLEKYPLILIDSKIGEEEPHLSGVFWIDVEIMLRANADDITSTQFDDLMQRILDQMNYDDLEVQLSDLADDFHIYGVFGREEIPFEVNDRHWNRGIKVRLTGMGMDNP